LSARPARPARGRGLLAAATAATLALGVTAAAGAPPTSAAGTVTTIVFNGEGNNLNAYDPAAGTRQNVVPNWNRAPGTGKDINAQICFFPDGSGRFIAGEDTFQERVNPATGLNELMGWGIFQLNGRRVGDLSATQLGKLTPTFQPMDDNPENYGCGFLSDGRVVTTDVGDQQPQATANGQLIVWFPPFESYAVRYCKVDVAIGTANQIYVGADDTVYVASARPDKAGNLGGIYAYRNLPTSDNVGGGCGATDVTGAPLATRGSYTKTPFIVDQVNVPTPNALVPSGHGTYYVSSVFTGVIAEYSLTGTFIRRVSPRRPATCSRPTRPARPWGSESARTARSTTPTSAWCSGPRRAPVTTTAACARSASSTASRRPR
jgi:hypothetical protein